MIMGAGPAWSTIAEIAPTSYCGQNNPGVYVRVCAHAHVCENEREKCVNPAVESFPTVRAYNIFTSPSS